MKVSKRNFQRGGYYENKTDFVLAPQDYAALGAAYDATTQKYLDAQAKAKKDADKKAVEGIQAFENRTKVMDRHNGILQGAYDIWFDARTAAISDPTAENKQKAEQAYSQYSVIKENATAITADYQKEVNALNKGELDATLIGNRAGALIDAQDFNQEIPFQVQNGRIMVPGADGQPVDWSQSTFYNESVFGQNGRNFIATRKAPGTDFMFAPKSDEYSQQLQGSADIFLMEGERKKGIDAVAVGAQVEQRFRSSMLSEPSAVVDAIAQEYGAFNQNVENLTVEGMLKADADFGGTELYTSKDNKFLTDWKLSFVPGEDENSPGEYKVSFMNPDEAISTGDLNPNTAAAIKNRQNALGFHIENLANQTLYKLKSQVQPDPKTSSFGYGFKKGDILPVTQEVTLFTEEGAVTDAEGNEVKGERMNFRNKPLNLRYKDESAKITNIQYDKEGNPFAFVIESNAMKNDIVSSYTDQISALNSRADRLSRQLSGSVSVGERNSLKSQLSEIESDIESFTNARTNFKKSKEGFIIDRDNKYMGADIFLGGTPQDIPGFEEILTSLMSQEPALMSAIDEELGGSLFQGSSPSPTPAPSAGVGAKYN
jgi:hypothetical protein